MNNNFKINNKFHLGVYGILLKNDLILLVKKSRGPYAGKLDLPGGKPEHSESPNQALAREILEETGVEICASKLFDNYSIVVEHAVGENIKEKMHHMGMIYLILSYDEKTLIHEMDAEDSLGSQWCRLVDLTEDMLSPFAFKVIKDLKKLIV